MKPKITIENLTVYKKPEESPGYLLWRVSSRWRSAIEDTLKPLDLTHPQFVILATVGWLTKDQTKISQIDISKAAELDPNAKVNRTSFFPVSPLALPAGYRY